MKLEVGKKYLNRKGEVVKITGSGMFGKEIYFVSDYNIDFWFYADGRLFLNREDICDLIKEYDEENTDIFKYSVIGDAHIIETKDVIYSIVTSNKKSLNSIFVANGYRFTITAEKEDGR